MASDQERAWTRSVRMLSSPHNLSHAAHPLTQKRYPTDVMNGLIADPRRQAGDSIRGYIYQVVRSVEAWLALKDGESLYLEGAEDLDIIDDKSAVVEQVKDTCGSGNVTLRSASAVDAINNFWAHRARNPGRAISFRYLTTSGVGAEAQSPFAGERGIDLWTQARKGQVGGAEIARSIGDFLLQLPTISDTVKAFIAAASPDEIFQELIEPFEWATAQDDTAALVKKVKDALVLHGQSTGLAPADAELAFDPLYSAAFDAAASKSATPLTRSDFLRIFGAATGLHISKTDHAALVRAALGQAGELTAIESRPSSLEGRPPTPAHYFVRRSIEAKLEHALNGGVAVLHGATGMGKTLLASSALASHDSAWLTLRDLGPAATNAQLRKATEILRSEGRARALVLDDLNSLDDPRIVEGALSILASAQRELGGRLVVTSDRPLSSRLCQAIGLAGGAEILMTPFADEEVRAYLISEGCPNSEADAWQSILELTTAGHPQLIHARIASLRAAGFPAPTANDFLDTPADIDRVKTEAGRLIAALPEAPRELLYRASLITGRINRKRLMAIAKLEMPLAEPGTAIDAITGPWLEATAEGDYRVSPLARGAAEVARGHGWVVTTHSKIAWIFLLDRAVTPLDVAAVLTHCVLGRSAGPLARLMPSLLSAPDEVWAQISDTCAIFSKIGIGIDGKMPFSSAADAFLFRIIQYRIAAFIDPAAAPQIAEQFDVESQAAPRTDELRFFRFIFLMQLLHQVRVKLPIAAIIKRGLEFGALARELAGRMPNWPRVTELGNGSAPLDFDQFMGLPLISAINGFDAFQELFDAVGKLPAADGLRVLSGLAPSHDQAMMLVDKMWLAEFQQKRTGWDEVRDGLRSAFECSLSLGATAMAAAIAPTLVRVIAEDLGCPEAAVEEADELLAALGDNAILQCAKAKALKDQGQLEEALALWENALPAWPGSEADFNRPHAYREAGVAASRAGRWASAAEFFAGGAEALGEGLNTSYWLGLKMDAAFARFMAGEQSAAVRGFAIVVDALALMGSDLEREPALSLQRRINSLLLAVIEVNSDPSRRKYLETLGGVCSVLDPLETEAVFAPPADMLRMHLIHVDLIYGDLSIASANAPFLRKTPYLAFRMLAGMYLFELAIRTRTFEAVVLDGLMQLDAMAEVRARKAEGADAPLAVTASSSHMWAAGSEDLLLGNLVLCAFAAADASELDALPFEAWRRDAAAHPQANAALVLIDLLQALFITGDVDPWSYVIKPAVPTWYNQLAAALAATILQELSPEQLISAHGVWVNNLQQPTFRKNSGVILSNLVAEQWWAVCLDPAGPIPWNIHAQALESALSAGGNDWRKVKEVLSAAADVVSLPSDHRARLAIASIEY